MMERMILVVTYLLIQLFIAWTPGQELISILIFIGIVFLANNAVTYGILGLFTLMAILLSKIPIKFLFKGLSFYFG